MITGGRNFFFFFFSWNGSVDALFLVIVFQLATLVARWNAGNEMGRKKYNVLVSEVRKRRNGRMKNLKEIVECEQKLVHGKIEGERYTEGFLVWRWTMHVTLAIRWLTQCEYDDSGNWKSFWIIWWVSGRSPLEFQETLLDIRITWQSFCILIVFIYLFIYFKLCLFMNWN